MTTTIRQNSEFVQELLGNTALDTSIDWIASHLELDDVFTEEAIKDYVTLNMNVEDVFADPEITRYVRETFHPDDVYPADELEEWAVNHGFQKM